MKIAVLGSGNGGHAVAFESARAGHDVYMFDFPQFSASIDAIAAAGGVYSHGLMEGFQKVSYAGTDISKVVPGADLILLVGPAYSTEPFAKACIPYVTAGQTYVVMPGSGAGALVFKKALGYAADDYSITVADMHTLPYAARLCGPAEINTMNRTPGGCYMATLPREKGDELFATMSAIFPGLEKGEGILQTTLQNGNPVIHPAVMTLNAALIERTGGDFWFYNEGVTPAVGNLMKAIDDERIALGKALGVTVIPDPVIGVAQGYNSEPTYVRGYNDSPGFTGIKAPHSLDYRYYNEDVGYSMMLWIDLADRMGVEVPVMKALVKIVSVITGKDFAAENARSLESVGLGSFTPEELKKL